MEEVDRLIIHALEQIGVSRLSSSSSSSSVSSLRDFTVEDAVEGASRCLMAIDPALNLPLKMPPAMAGRYRIGTDLAAAVRGVGFHREIGYQTFMYLNENDLRDLFVFLVENLPKEKMDDGDDDDDDDDISGGGGAGKKKKSAENEAALMIRRKCVEAIAAELKADRRTPMTTDAGGGGAEKPVWRKKADDPKAAAAAALSSSDVARDYRRRPYRDFETIRLKIPRFEDETAAKEQIVDSPSSSLSSSLRREYDREILPWVWEQTDDQSVLVASLMEANAKSLLVRRSGQADSVVDGDGDAFLNYDVGAMLKRAIAAAKSSLVIDDHFSASTTTTMSSKSVSRPAGDKPIKPAKPAVKLTTSTTTMQATEAEAATDAPAASSAETDADGAGSAYAESTSSTSAEEKVVLERESALEKLASDCEEARVAIEKLKEEIVLLREAKGRKEARVVELRQERREIESRVEEWEKISSLLPDAEENAKKLEVRLANSQQKMVKLQEEWNGVRLPMEEEIRAASAAADVKTAVLAGLADELAAASAKCSKLKDDAAEKDAKLKAVAKQLEAAFPKGPDGEAAAEEEEKKVSRNSFTKRILEIVHNIKKQKAELDRIIADTKELSKTVNSLEGKLERSFALADELVFKDAKKDEAVRKAYKLLAALHETCGALIGVVDEIGATVRGCRDKEDETERELGLEMESNLEKISRDLESMKRENADAAIAVAAAAAAKG